MTDGAPEGPKADYGPEQASEGYIPKPPTPRELDRLSEAQGMITDEWTGEPGAKDRPVSGSKPGKD